MNNSNSQTTVNGRFHYETWTVKHWLNNAPQVKAHWSKVAQQAFEQCRERGDPVMKLSEELESWHLEKLPGIGGLYADLLKATLRRVDWAEVAVSLLADVEDRVTTADH
jgi:hypothetical protein